MLDVKAPIQTQKLKVGFELNTRSATELMTSATTFKTTFIKLIYHQRVSCRTCDCTPRLQPQNISLSNSLLIVISILSSNCFILAHSTIVILNELSKLRNTVHIGPSPLPACTAPSIDLHHSPALNSISNFLFLCPRGIFTWHSCTVLPQLAFILRVL